MLKFTLDTNCIIALDENRAEARAIYALLDAYSVGKADVALVAISASEKQRDGGHLESFAEFQQRLAALKLDHLTLLPPMFYWDITFWDWCLWCSPEMQTLETKIHQILFPNIECDWTEFCTARGIEITDLSMAHKWKNAKCDVQGIWSHIHHKRDVFVTSDQNFHASSKKEKLILLGAGRIETPDSALLLISEPP